MGTDTLPKLFRTKFSSNDPNSPYHVHLSNQVPNRVFLATYHNSGRVVRSVFYEMCRVFHVTGVR